MDLVHDRLGLAEKAAEALRAETAINLVPLTDMQPPADAEQGFHLRFEQGTTTFETQAEIIGTVRVTEAQAALIARRFGEFANPAVLIARYVPPTMARKLKQLNVMFVDTVGNAYLNLPPIQVFIYGNKPVDQRRTHAEKGIFTKGGVKVVFALLCQRELKDATYRQIAEAAMVALGTVDTVMTRLQRNGFLIERGTHGRRLERKKELLDRWAIAYAEQLRPKQLIGIYRTANAVEWLNEAAPGERALWGGETAAAKLTNYLKPLITTIYTQKPVKDLLFRYKLTPDEKGLVELREVFWNFQPATPIPHIVPPLLVYADLMANADPRNVETANLIYDEHLQRLLRED